MAGALAAGCGRGDSMTEEEFCQEVARRECGKVATICGTPVESCGLVRAAVCRETAAQARAGGRVYNPAGADGCLDRISDVYQTLPIFPQALKDLDEVCARVFRGAAHASQPCMVDYDCDKNLVCDKGRCGTPKTVAAGAGCANIGERCPSGQYCSNASAVYVCTKRQDRGQTCAPALPCLERYRCAGTCVERLPSGVACERDDDCETAYCNPYGAPRCVAGLTFSPDSPSCLAYMGAPTPVADAAAAQ